MSSHPIPRRNLEGLFRHALNAKGPFLERLVAAGYDPTGQVEGYSLEVYRRCLEIARTTVFPDKPVDDAYRLLGRAWFDGFTQTRVGKVLLVIARLVGPERIITRIPVYVKAGREDVEASVRALGPRHWCITVFDVSPTPMMTAGIMEGVMRSTGVAPTLSVEPVDANRYDLHIRWQADA